MAIKNIRNIKTNLTTFTNEEVIVLKQEKSLSNKNIISTDKHIEKKDFKLLIDDLDRNKSITIDKNFFRNLYSVEFLKDFLIYKTHSVDIKIYSFYTCILSALDDKFLNTKISEYLQYINSLIQYLKMDIMQDGFRINGYSKLKWTKNKILEDLNKNNITEKVIRYVGDALHINIFIIDNNDDNKIKYAGGDYVPFKKNVLLLKIKDEYYLICTQNEKYFVFNKNDFIKSLLINPEYINLLLCEHFVCVGRNYINNAKLENTNLENINNEGKNICEITISISVLIFLIIKLLFCVK